MGNPLAAVDAFFLLHARLVRAARRVFPKREREIELAGGRQSLSPVFSGGEEHLDAASIGFTGRGVSGAVVLVAPSATVRRLRGDEPGLDDVALRDTIAEYANMVLGELKRELLRVRIDLQMATPTSFCARGLGLPASSLPHSVWDSVDSGAGEIGVRLDVAFEGETVPLDEPALEPAATGGDVMFF